MSCITLLPLYKLWQIIGCVDHLTPALRAFYPFPRLTGILSDVSCTSRAPILVLRSTNRTSVYPLICYRAWLRGRDLNSQALRAGIKILYVYQFHHPASMRRSAKSSKMNIEINNKDNGGTSWARTKGLKLNRLLLCQLS